MRHDIWMKKAVEEAKKAEKIGEVPIGAVIVRDEEILGKGHNLREHQQDPTAHAEVVAIRDAAQKVGSWRLSGCRLYVTLEPCPMCSGAILLSRIDTLVYGAYDPKGGCAGTLMNLLVDERFNHRVEVVDGIAEAECARLLKDFFRSLRRRSKRD
ncbi:tRNA adenosine(34) deaminase TadA [Paludifilum halophilum]|uniref:tRNA-specific adenosine deaminase n=1 Tax=Paludifilum halophilum TaxID=1642702 RepID=A0A235B1Y7_9BACL|nr:tRNA adenosine(34) deaminase TadA [Paludifilum halophilum]OYD06303.1 tRNA-specific adenosine deaminase [Paludifilum halophilum]